MRMCRRLGGNARRGSISFSEWYRTDTYLSSAWAGRISGHSGQSQAWTVVTVSGRIKLKKFVAHASSNGNASNRTWHISITPYESSSATSDPIYTGDASRSTSTTSRPVDLTVDNMDVVLSSGQYKLWVYATNSNYGYVTGLSTGSYETGA